MTQPKPIRASGPNTVTLPEPARLKLAQRWALVTKTHQEFQEYLAAMAAAVGFEGEFTCDLATGVLTPKEGTGA